MKLNSLVKTLSSLIIMASPLSFRKSTPVPIVTASHETKPIPFGFHDSDDATVWLNPDQPEQSLILGTSKFEPKPDSTAQGLEGYGGLGTYRLDGSEARFLPGDRLNNVDMLNDRCPSKGCTGDLAVASNRSINGITIFQVSTSRVSAVSNIPLFDEAGQSLKVYGLCTTLTEGRTLTLVTTKKGIAYLFELRNLPDPNRISNVKLPVTAHLIKTENLAALVTPAQDQGIQTLVEKGARAEGELDDLEKKLKERFALEGCAYDRGRQRWLLGMENFGIWSIPQESKVDLKHKQVPFPLLLVQGSWTDIDQWAQNPKVARITDDLEGIDVFTYDQKDYLLFSSQGISEFGLYDLSLDRYIGNFAINFNEKDPVTKTDGVAVKSAPMGPNFPRGVLVVHDDSNESDDSNLEAANYKIVDLLKVMSLFPTHEH